MSKHLQEQDLLLDTARRNIQAELQDTISEKLTLQKQLWDTHTFTTRNHTQLVDHDPQQEKTNASYVFCCWRQTQCPSKRYCIRTQVHLTCRLLDLDWWSLKTKSKQHKENMTVNHSSDIMYCKWDQDLKLLFSLKGRHWRRSRVPPLPRRQLSIISRCWNVPSRGFRGSSAVPWKMERPWEKRENR